MNEMDIAPVLAWAILREQFGGKYDSFQETRISNIPFDKSMKHRGRESPCLFNFMMKSIFGNMQKDWKDLCMEVKMRGSEADHEEERVNNMIFADNCYLFAES